jgi:hypothetical protein
MVEAAARHNRVVQVGTQQRSGEHFMKAVERSIVNLGGSCDLGGRERRGTLKAAVSLAGSLRHIPSSSMYKL